MDFIDNKPIQLQEEESFTNNYEDVSSAFSRRILLYNTLKYLTHVKDRISTSQPDAPLTTKDLLAIRS